MKKSLNQKKYYYVFYDNSFGNGGKEGRGFYYENKKKNLYLRFAFFKTGNLTTLVSSKHSLKKIRKLLSKPKPLLINRCCAFKVLEIEFQASDRNFGKQFYQISYDEGKTYYDYKNGSNKKIDAIFENADVYDREKSDWIIYDFAEILEPHFGITDVTSEYKSGIFQLNNF